MPKNAKDKTGKHYGDLEVIGRNGSNERGDPLWTCRCNRCGLKRKKTVDAVTVKNMQTSLEKLLVRFLLFVGLALMMLEMHYIYVTVISVGMIKNSRPQQFVKSQKDADANNIIQIK